MASKSIRYIFTILFVSVVCCNCQSDNPSASSSWAKLQISPDTLSSMEYGNYLIEIYEHTNNHKVTTTASQKKFFYSPLALLDHKSAVSSYNNVTKKPEMRFRIEMWNDKVQNEVVKHLGEIVGHQIKSNKVRVLPLEKIILTSRRPITVDYSLYPEWTNYDKSKTLILSLSCYDQKTCDQLANEMRTKPEQFDHFKLLYSLSSQTSQTKQTIISIDSVTSGTLVSTLLKKFRDKQEVYLTANDEKKMLTETATNILMDTFDDSEVGSPETESQILNILKGLLVTSGMTVTKTSDKMWDSVFWNEDNYRPDKTTKTLNEIVNKLDAETRKKLTDMFQKTEKQSGLEDKFDSSTIDKEIKRISSAISGKMATDSDSSRRVEILKEEVEKLLQESRDHVQWDGEIFVPKPMQLSRINLDKFRDSQSFQDRKVRVRYTTAELSTQIKFLDHTEFAVTDKWNNLKDELKATTELLSTTANNLSKTNAELSNEKSDLTYTRIDLTNKLEGRRYLEGYLNLEGTKMELQKIKIDLEETRASVKNLSIQLNENKQELVKTRAVFSKSVDNFSIKLKATEKELADMKNTTGNLSTELKETKQELVKTRTDLTKNFDGLSKQFKATEKEFADIKITTVNLSTEIKMNSNQLRQDLKVAEEKITRDLRATSTDLENTKTTLVSTKTDFSTKLIETKQELVKTRTDLSKNFDGLSIQFKATEKEFADIKITTGNLSTELKMNPSQLRQDLKVTEEKFIKDLRETKQELVKTRTDLTKNFDGLSKQFKATEKEFADIKITTLNLSTEIKMNSNQLRQDLKVAEGKITRDLRATSTDLENTKTTLLSTRTDLSTKLIETNQELVKTRTDLSKNFDGLSKQFKVTEKEFADMKITTGNLSTELKMNSNQLRQDLKTAEEKLKRDLRATSNDFKNLKTTLASTRTDLSSTKFTVVDLSTKLNARTSELVDIGRMPTSCWDLQRMGHKLSGFFSVKGLKKIEIIFCNFNNNQNETQKWIGFTDVKSAPVHFYVQRNSSFNTTSTPILFDLARMNEGNAMDLTSGKFTAPRTGIYFFSFTGLARISSSSDNHFLYSSLYLNGNIIGTSFVSEERSVTNKFSPLTLQSTLKLNKGDQVWVGIYSFGPSSYFYLHDDGDHLTHFTGFMLEEIVASF